eukprot:TRINITY_DN3876_c0_g1_i1.p1 TRINITY_DN3876_c0_g1~~TRINITY_DN3876_c0_g1_i1.p1  ORF type:complete len:583 (-),score=133.84 TRINITY_DN3876_c0_g1_i1:567-2315(-)
MEKVGNMKDKPKGRVKVYQLDAQGQWEDKGTGYVACSYHEKHQCMCLVVTSETDANVLLETKVYPEDIYQLQQETLVVWNDPETDADLALSFQEATDCKDILEQIAAAQKLNSEDGDLNSTVNVDESVQEQFELPAANLNNLNKILELINKAHSNAMFKERVVTAISKEEYVAKLIDVFTMSEDLEQRENLTLLFAIFKGLVLLNDTTIYEILFSDDYIMEVMGALEYDPDLPKQIQHRAYLKSHVAFKEVVPFDNPDLVNKIHQTFRIQYLKDVALPRSLDDPSFATLNSLIFFNNVEIVSTVQNDERFLTDLFRRIREQPKAQDLKDLVTFVQELCNLARNLQAASRKTFYHTLSKHGICDTLELSLSYDDVAVRLSTVNIIESILTFDSPSLRKFLLSQKPHFTLFNQIVNGFLRDAETGIRVQLTEILRILIDISNIGDETTDREDFLGVFYNEFIQKITEPLSNDSSKEPVVDSVKESICNLLAFCIHSHGRRTKYFLLGNSIPSKILKLLSSNQKHVQLGAIRFFRAFVNLKDDFFNRHITKNNLFEPIIRVFKENSAKYNLINSAIIELFEFIRK